MSANGNLISPKILKDRTQVHTNIDEKLIFPTIKVCQDMYIHPILGTALYDKIVGDVPDVTGDYKTLLDDYIIDCLCWYVLSELVFDTTYQTWNKGVLKKTSDNTELPDLQELQNLSDRYRGRAEWYAERLKNYLIANATTSFLPEYINGNSNIDDINPGGNTFSLPIVLDDYNIPVHPDKNNCHCNETQ